MAAVEHSERGFSSRPAFRELRSESRKPLLVQARVMQEDGPTIHAVTGSICAHGLDLVTADPLPPATRCKIWLALPIDGRSRPVVLDATVVHCTDGNGHFDVGVVLFGMQQRTQELIQGFLCL